MKTYKTLKMFSKHPASEILLVSEISASKPHLDAQTEISFRMFVNHYQNTKIWSNCIFHKRQKSQQVLPLQQPMPNYITRIKKYKTGIF